MSQFFTESEPEEIEPTDLEYIALVVENITLKAKLMSLETDAALQRLKDIREACDKAIKRLKDETRRNNS